MSKEIVMAGVRYNNKVYDGFNHGECFKKLPNEANMVNVEQGFITNDGEFVDREKAFTIARKAHQLEYDYGIQKTLISEDIHINWLHKKDQKIANLEAKLAESEKEREIILKENEELVVKHNVYIWGDEIQQDKIYAITGEVLDFLINNRDKISFTVEKLEKVKKQLRQDVNITAPISELKKLKDYLISVDDFIDKQIKQLKEGK